MIKKLFFGILIAGSQLIQAQEIQSNEYDVKSQIADYNLKGNVKQVTSTAKDSKGNWATIPFLENEFFNQIVLEFDTEGNLVKRTNNLDYRGQLATYSFTEYRYNQQKNPSEIKTTIINNGEDPKRISSLKNFEYNAKGQLTKVSETVQSKTSTTKYQTDFILSHRIESAVNKTDGTVSGEIKYSYNKSGQLIKQEAIGFDGKNGQKKYFIYDGKIPVYEELNVNGNKQMIFIDTKQSQSKYQQFDQNQHLKLELTFDHNQHVTEAKVQSFYNGKPVLKTYQIKYLFDHYKNWTDAEIYSNGNLEFTINRIITYR